MSLHVVVAGAGIAGLATAIGLARHGHKVTVIEKRALDDQEQSGSAIQLALNATQILTYWGMKEDMLKVSLENSSLDARQWDTGETWGFDESFTRDGAWFTMRRDIRDNFRLAATRNGATMRDGASVIKVDPSGPTAYLDDGTTVEADLIVGGDGAFSRVRQSLFPDFRTDVLNHVCYQVTTPLDEVLGDSELKSLVSGSSPILWIAPNRHIIAAPIYKRNIYETQLLDAKYDPSKDSQSEVLQGRIGVDKLRKTFADHPADMRKLLDRAQSCWKWRLVEVNNIPSWSSENGKVIMVGDAVHAMIPYAAQGSAMGIEDGAVLSELLAGAQKGDDLRKIAKLYEQLRRPRADRIADYARSIEQFATTTDPAIRNIMKEGLQNGIKPDFDACEADANAEYPTDSFKKWVFCYDAVADAQQASKKAVNGSAT